VLIKVGRKGKMPLSGGAHVGHPFAAMEAVAGPASPAFSVNVRAGHLIEVRVRRMDHLADLESLHQAVFRAIHQAGPGAVILADHRLTAPVPPRIANAWSRAMRSANGLVARSAFLLDPDNAVYNMQLARVVRCSCHDARRLFTDTEELCIWTGGALSGIEREALHALFFGGAG
jgi:hypothetical protein